MGLNAAYMSLIATTENICFLEGMYMRESFYLVDSVANIMGNYGYYPFLRQKLTEEEKDILLSGHINVSGIKRIERDFYMVVAEEA